MAPLRAIRTTKKGVLTGQEGMRGDRKRGEEGESGPRALSGLDPLTLEKGKEKKALPV